MIFEELKFKGCFKITPRVFSDKRGHFVKTFHEELFKKSSIDFCMKEEFYSTSNKNVFRGLHFQCPPHAHNKMAYCLKGSVIDFLIDLRKNSKTFGQSLSIELNELNCVSLFIPIGLAHGFLSLEDETTMVYKIDSVYHAESDAGVLWESTELKSIEGLTLSERDLAFPSLDSFMEGTPF